MSVTLRLTRMGSKNRPCYRIVAAESARPRDGRFLEIIGAYNPRATPAQVSLKQERVQYWIEHGASTSTVVASIIKKTLPGYLEGIEKRRVERRQALRKKRKTRLAAKSKGTAKSNGTKKAKKAK